MKIREVNEQQINAALSALEKEIEVLKRKIQELEKTNNTKGNK